MSRRRQRTRATAGDMLTREHAAAPPSRAMLTPEHRTEAPACAMLTRQHVPHAPSRAMFTREHWPITRSVYAARCAHRHAPQRVSAADPVRDDATHDSGQVRVEASAAVEPGGTWRSPPAGSPGQAGSEARNEGRPSPTGRGPARAFGRLKVGGGCRHHTIQVRPNRPGRSRAPFRRGIETVGTHRPPGRAGRHRRRPERSRPSRAPRNELRPGRVLKNWRGRAGGRSEQIKEQGGGRRRGASSTTGDAEMRRRCRQPFGFGRRPAGCGVAPPRRSAATTPSSSRLASGRPAPERGHVSSSAPC